MTQDLTYTVRVRGKVNGRPSALAYVSVPGEPPARVQWQGPGSGKGRAGFRCDEHKRVDYSDDCIHADLAEVALHWQRKNEKAEAKNAS